METKTFIFRLPTSLYEEFYRIFPGKGERSTFLRRMIVYAISLRKEKDCFERHVETKIKKQFEMEV